MKTLRRVILEAKRNSSGRKAQAEYARKHPDSDVAKRVAARAHGAKPDSAGLEKDFIGRFKPKEGQHARHQQTGMTAQERATNRGVEDTASYKTGRVKARQTIRRGGKIAAPTKQELDDLTSRTRANEPPRGRGDKVKKVGPSGRKDAKPENSNTAYPLTADRVFMFERTKAELKQKARGETAQERELRRERVYRKFTKSGRNPSKLGMKSANAITRKGEEVPGGVKAEHDWRSEKGIGQGSRAKEKRLDGYSSEKARKEAGDDYDDYVKTRDDAWRNR